MSYKFKVGDKGKTRRGEPYRVICDDRRGNGDKTLLALFTSLTHPGEHLGHYRPDGTVFGGRYTGDDLLPPTVTKYLNVGIPKGIRSTTSQVYESLNAAELYIDARPDVQWIIKAQPVEVQGS